MNAPHFNRRVLVGALLLALAPAAVVAQDGLPPASELIDRHVEAIGGRDAVLAPAGSHSTGSFSMPAAGLEARMEVFASSRPARMVSMIEIPGLGTIQQGFTGEYGWSVDPNLGPRLLDGLELAAIEEGVSNEASLRDPSMFTERTTVERTEIDGDACYRVRLVWKSGRETFDCYSVESGLLIASESDEETPMGTIPVVTLMRDYQQFGGILSPTLIVQRMMGQEQIVTIELVEYGEIQADRFAPPPAIETLIQGRESRR
jgi:hypothetical protein